MNKIKTPLGINSIYNDIVNNLNIEVIDELSNGKLKVQITAYASFEYYDNPYEDYEGFFTYEVCIDEKITLNSESELNELEELRENHPTIKEMIKWEMCDLKQNYI